MSSDDSEAFKEFFHAAAEGGWKLLQYYLCGPTRGFRASQRGNGLGGVHCARNSRRVVPLHIFRGISQQGRGRNEHSSVSAAEDEKEAKTCPKPVVVKMVTPAQQSTEQAKSNLKRQAQEREEETRTEVARHLHKRRRRTRKALPNTKRSSTQLPLFRK